METLADLRVRRAIECRLTPGRELRSLAEAEEYLHKQGLLTRTADCALPSLYEACQEEPYQAGGRGFASWPATKWPWFGELAERGCLVLGLSRAELRSLRAPLERSGAIIARSAEVTAGEGHLHTSELSRWDQAYPDSRDTDTTPGQALADLIVAGVRAAVVAPESDPRKWLAWPWYWHPTLIDDLTRAGRLHRVEDYVTAGG